MNAKQILNLVRGEGKSYWMCGFGGREATQLSFLLFQENLSSPNGDTFLYVVTAITLTLKALPNSVDSVVLLLCI